MKSTLKNIITISILFFTTSVKAQQAFSPFSFTNEGLKKRSDLKDWKYSVDINQEINKDIIIIKESNVNLAFHRDVIQFINKFTSPMTRIIPSASPLVNCNNHQTALNQHFYAAPTQCQKTQKLYQQINTELGNICKKMAMPYITFFPIGNDIEMLKKGKFNQENLKSLTGLIKIAVLSLYTLESFPKELLTQQLMDEFNLIALKLMWSDIQRELDKQKKLYRSLLQHLNEKPYCVENFSQNDKMTMTLLTELNYAEKNIQKILNKAKTEALDDHILANSARRTRDPLPFKTLSDQEREKLSMYLGALFWRMRGGSTWVDMSTRKRRNFFVREVFEVLARLNGDAHADKSARGLKARVRKGWGEWFDMGRTPGQNDKYYDLTRMTKRGLYQIGKGHYNLLDRFYYRNQPRKRYKEQGYDVRYLDIAGLQMGPCYFYTWEHISSQTLGPRWLPRKQQFIREGGTKAGEFCFGAALGLGLSKMLLNGKM